MNVTTPKTQQSGFEKRLHTPPTIEREKGRSTPTKFLKGLSSSIFKRSPDLKKQQVSRFDDNETEVNFSKIPTMSRRSRAPKPLNLSQPLSPPKSVKKYEGLTRNTFTSGSFQSVDTMNLASPVTLHGNLNEKPKNLARLLHDALDSPTLERRGMSHLSLDQPRQSIHSSGDLEDISSPSSRNASLMSSRNAKCFKKYIGERCCICDEAIYNSFTGERIIELSCSHITHNNCYLTLYESTFQDNEFPMCSICNIQVSPQDSELANTLASTVLTQTRKTSLNVSTRSMSTSHNDKMPLQQSKSQYLELKSAKMIDPTFMSFTPIDQIIKTADISCNGFEDLQNESEGRTLSDIRLSICDSIESETFSLFHSKLSSPSVKSPILDKRYSPNVSWRSNLNDDTVSLQVRFPNEKFLIKDNNNLQTISKDDIDKDKINATYKNLTQYIETRFFSNIITLDEEIRFDKLKIFDLVSYSTDNQNWCHNISIFYIDELIILYDHNMNKIVGKIPHMEISYVTTMENNTVLVIDTKSITLAEIFLKFNDDTRVVNKWKYFLQNENYETVNRLLHITDTALFILSDDLIDQIQEYNVAGHKSLLPWTQEEELPLRLILCIDLCVQNIDMGQYKLKLIGTIRNIMSKLKEKDLFGLVTIGNPDEKRNMFGYSGTYIGMIDTLWGEWDNIINDLEVNNNASTIKEEEIQSMMATCYRLVSTLSDNEIEMYQNKILYLNQFDNEDVNIDDMVINKKFHDIIFNKHQFQLYQYSLLEEDDNSNNNIDNLMRKLTCLNYLNVNIDIDGKTIYMGNINDMKDKTISDPMLQKLLTSNHQCKIRWEDKDSKETIHKTVTLSRG
ncbi:cyclin-dependent kinase inhibitor Far1p [Monosporozyma servazzii]